LRAAGRNSSGCFRFFSFSMRFTHFFSLVFFCSLALEASTQPKYWVFLQHRESAASHGLPWVSSKTESNRSMLGLPVKQETDLPPSQMAIQRVLNTGATLCRQSKWLNALSVQATEAQIQEILSLPEVKGVTLIGFMITAKSKSDSVEVEKFTETIRQIQGQLLSEMGLNGAGVTIGVTDAGFFEADKNEYLQHVHKRNGVKATRDFVNPQQTDVYQSLGSSDDHGVEVLSYMAGYKADKKGLTGLAWCADFVLARTDHQVNESRIDEDNWVAALEWLDSLGVRLVNTSLGYGLGYDNPDENYKPEQMDGKQSVVVKAANMAAKQKGMILVVAAGNDGGKQNWRIISTPADAESVLSVGATNYTNWNKMSYSGVGPKHLSYLKPDVSSASLNGTSFSAPVVCGLIACLLQWKPALSSDSLFNMVRRSGHLWPFPNNYLGYGVPQAGYIIKYLKTGIWHEKMVEEIKAKSNAIFIQVPEEWKAEYLGIFHKTDERFVVNQTNLTVSKNRMVVRQHASATRSTVHHAYGIWEIFWP